MATAVQIVDRVNKELRGEHEVTAFTTTDPYVMMLLVLVNKAKNRALKENRQDDADETVIRRRFEVYDRETAPVLSYYDKTLIGEVNAAGTPAEVLLHVLETIVPAYREHFGNPIA